MFSPANSSTICSAASGPVGTAKRSTQGQAGQGLAEYLIIVVVIAIVVLIGIRVFGSSITGQFQSATEEIETAGSGGGKGGGDQSVGTPVNESSAKARKSSSHESSSDSDDTLGGASGSSGDRDDRFASLREPGVGEDEGKYAAKVEIDSTLLWILGGVAVAAGIAVLLRMRKQMKNKGGKKKEKKKKRSWFKQKQSTEQGQAIVEFLFVAITLLFCILGVMQLALCLNAQALVRYAAYNVARSAIVHGGDEEMMKEAARMSLLAIYPRHGRADHVKGLTENYLGALATDDDTNLTYYGEKITEVKILNSAAGGGGVVTFDDPQSAQNAVITVQVVHRYELVIPLVNRIIFYVYTQFRDEGGYQGETLDRMAYKTDKMRRGGDFSDIEYRIPLVAHYTMRLQSDRGVN